MMRPARPFAFLLLGALMGCSSGGDGGVPGTAGSAGSGAAPGEGGATGGVSGSGGSAATSGGSGVGGATAGSGGAGAGGAAGTAGVAGGAGADGGAGAGAAGGAAGAGGSAATGGAGGAAGAGGAPTVANCFQGVFVNQSSVDLGPNYDQFGPVVGSHCKGTNHQDIRGVERVVFLGDSVTVGTPPTLSQDYYRSRLAARLATHFGLRAPSALWNQVNLIDGVSLQRSSGDFASCAKWGARTDDLRRDSTQIVDCIPPAERNKRHLVVMTMGGNDIASITKDGVDGQTPEQIWPKVISFVELMRDAVVWLKDPANVPGGVDVVFANMFEFTDGTGETTACPAAGLAGFGAPWADPDALKAMVIYAQEQFMKIAVDTQSDMIFLFESFCGHGFNAGKATAPCYRGPGSAVWFDLTCIHPNPAGHATIADLFFSVVRE